MEATLPIRSPPWFGGEPDWMVLPDRPSPDASSDIFVVVCTRIPRSECRILETCAWSWEGRSTHHLTQSDEG